MVKPGGTGSPRFAISARLAPLPPSRSRICALPSALPPPKAYTHLAAGAWARAGLMAEGLDMTMSHAFFSSRTKHARHGPATLHFGRGQSMNTQAEAHEADQDQIDRHDE